MKLQERIEQWQSAMETLTAQQSGLSDRIDRLATQIQDNPETARRLQTELTAAQAALTENTTRMQETQTELDGLKAQLAHHALSSVGGVTPPTAVVPVVKPADGNSQQRKRDWI